MQITKEEVQRIAKLARLKLTDEEIKAAVKDLSGILEHFSAIQNIDTEGVPTSDDASGLINVMREDIAEQGSIASGEDVVNAAPETKDGQLKVKSVF